MTHLMLFDHVTCSMRLASSSTRYFTVKMCKKCWRLLHTIVSSSLAMQLRRGDKILFRISSLIISDYDGEQFVRISQQKPKMLQKYKWLSFLGCRLWLRSLLLEYGDSRAVVSAALRPASGLAQCDVHVVVVVKTVSIVNVYTIFHGYSVGIIVRPFLLYTRCCCFWHC